MVPEHFQERELFDLDGANFMDERTVGFIGLGVAELAAGDGFAIDAEVCGVNKMPITDVNETFRGLLRARDGRRLHERHDPDEQVDRIVEVGQFVGDRLDRCVRTRPRSSDGRRACRSPGRARRAKVVEPDIPSIGGNFAFVA
jgi:hypothetical protein